MEHATDDACTAKSSSVEFVQSLAFSEAMLIIFLALLFSQRGVAAVAKNRTVAAAGFSRAGCESHPHSGVQTQDSSYLMVGDAECWDSSASVGDAKRHVFVVLAEAKTLKERWRATLGSTGYNYGKSGLELADGSILVAGTKSTTPATPLGRNVQSRVIWRLDRATGAVLSETLLGTAGGGVRDGFMHVVNAASALMTVFATGYVSAESGNNDDPMFLVYGGVAFVARLRFSADQSEPPIVEYDVPFPLDTAETNGFIPMQGMRVAEDVVTGQLTVAAAASTGPFDERDYDYHFSLFAVDAATGRDLRWAKMYKEADAPNSHPYGLVLSASGEDGDAVVAGHAYPLGLEPEGRLLKANGSTGELVWDRRFTDRDPQFFNIECYSVDRIPSDGGFIVACGNGPMTIYPWMDYHQRSWTAFVYRSDSEGLPMWTANVTDSADQCVNDAAEWVIQGADGDIAVYIDSSTLGLPENGGNFGLVVFNEDGHS